MKKIAFVMMENGIFSPVSVSSRFLLSRAISNLTEGRLDYVFISASDAASKKRRIVEDEHLSFMPEGKRKNVELCDQVEMYGEAFSAFLVDREIREAGVFIYATLSLRDVIVDNLNLCLEKLRDEGNSNFVPLMFTN